MNMEYWRNVLLKKAMIMDFSIEELRVYLPEPEQIGYKSRPLFRKDPNEVFGKKSGKSWKKKR